MLMPLLSPSTSTVTSYNSCNQLEDIRCTHCNTLDRRDANTEFDETIMAKIVIVLPCSMNRFIIAPTQ
jgi:hypothetical protein